MKLNNHPGDIPGDVGARPPGSIQKLDKENIRIMGKVMLVLGALIVIAIAVMFFT